MQISGDAKSIVEQTETEQIEKREERGDKNSCGHIELLRCCRFSLNREQMHKSRFLFQQKTSYKETSPRCNSFLP
jgi:hypothetical protein